MIESDGSSNVRGPVAADILDAMETLLLEARAATQPLEVEPWRSRLFELFVTADGACLIEDDRHISLSSDDEHSEIDLSADGICRSLARRWGLDMAARDSVASQSRLPADQLEQMRLLWSVMRMWMEWSYAWKRWDEFHQG